MGGTALLAILITLAASPDPRPQAITSSTATFFVTVRGSAGEIVRLRSVDVPAGYFATFCTSRLCAPYRVSFVLPKSGRSALKMQIINAISGARPPRKAVVIANGVRAATDFSRGTRTKGADRPERAF